MIPNMHFSRHTPCNILVAWRGLPHIRALCNRGSTRRPQAGRSAGCSSGLPQITLRACESLVFCYKYAINEQSYAGNAYKRGNAQP